MAEVIDQAQHEFWRAPMPLSASSGADRSSTCDCGSEFIVSSVYCHACGSRRAGVGTPAELVIPGLQEFASLAERLDVGKASAIAFLMGVFCILGALGVSLFFSSRTLLDWQAIQLWRIEWLLAAVASFVAGVLLKK